MADKNYHRIEKAIHYIIANQDRQPSLEEIAQQVNMSSYHFQRVFSAWAGTSPKQFLQYLTLNHAKALLTQQAYSTLETAYQVGLSSTSRLHDLFTKIEGMSPAEYKNGSESLTLYYEFYDGIFGQFITASTEKGVCLVSFCETEQQGITELQSRFPQAKLIHQSHPHHQAVVQFFNQPKSFNGEIKLHLKGTPFQLKIWEALLTIPSAKLNTYSDVADKIGNHNAQRAVGSAIAKNPIAVIIPCHRVIQKSGEFGNYYWGKTRKASLIGWESAQTTYQDK